MNNQNSNDAAQNSSIPRTESLKTSELNADSTGERDWLHDYTSVTITVQDVANRLHQDIYGAESEHVAIHSCPCFSFARWYLGVDGKPKMYWPDGKGGNAWDKKADPERETETTTQG